MNYNSLKKAELIAIIEEQNKTLEKAKVLQENYLKMREFMKKSKTAMNMLENAVVTLKARLLKQDEALIAEFTDYLKNKGGRA